MRTHVLLAAVLVTTLAGAAHGDILMYGRGTATFNPHGPSFLQDRWVGLPNGGVTVNQGYQNTPPPENLISGYIPAALAGGHGSWFHAIYSPINQFTQLYMSSSPTSLGNMVWSDVGVTVDAMAIGNFRGVGVRLIVGLNGLKGEGAAVYSFDCHTGLSCTHQPLYGYDPAWRIDALATGDFDGTGFDRLAWGFNSVDGHAEGIWVTDFGWNVNPSSALSMGDGYQIAALTAGDYQHVGHADLVTALTWTSSDRNTHGSSIWRHDRASASKRPILGWEWDGYNIDSMASGKFVSPALGDQLVIGYTLPFNGSHLNFSSDANSFPNEFTLGGFSVSTCGVGPLLCPANSRMMVAALK